MQQSCIEAMQDPELFWINFFVFITDTICEYEVDVT
jgi:hypothetical protein